MLKRIILCALFCAISGFSSLSLGEDIDIFLKNPASSAGNPNILFVLDNTANWSGTLSNGPKVTKFEAEVKALNNVIDELDSSVNVGLMMLTSPNKGGYVRFAIRPMDDDNRADFKRVLNGLDVNSDKTSGGAPYGVSMFEAFKYFGGGGTLLDTTPSPANSSAFGLEAYAGAVEKQRDYAGNTYYSPLLPSTGAAFSSASAKNYRTPVTDECAKNFIILMSNGSPPTSSDAAASGLLTNIGGNATAIPLTSSRSTANYADEFARFLYQTDVSPLSGQQRVITYTLAVYQTPIKGQDPDNVLLMKSTANQGKGRYFDATDPESLAESLNTIFREINAVDSVFASVTLPVSVNVRGTHLNQVYMGVFRPNALDLPRWYGNLKHYKLATDNSTGAIFLADANSRKVFSPITGFLVDDAESIWTKSSTYWSFSPSGNPESSSDLPDGSVVEKGGVAQQLRETYATKSLSERKVFTGNMISFDTGSIKVDSSTVQADFGVNSEAELIDLIEWVRGVDNFEDENTDGSLSDIRASIHGDVLHSRPAVINYNRFDDDNDVVAFYGTNDGFLRAVKVGGDISGGAGKELWAYVAEEFYEKLVKLRDNKVARSPIDPKPYFFDGPITTLEHAGRRYLYVASRRGGEVMYAFDVTVPESPLFKWKITNTGSFSELGETWSAPQPAIVEAYNGGNTPVLIFGGGYDSNQDKTNPSPDSVGRTIFVVDAITGAFVWKAGASVDGNMEHSIPSDVIVIDRNKDGFSDRVYVGDMGGNLWRMDMLTNSFADWKLRKLAVLGDPAVAVSRRKLFYPPDVVATEDLNGDYDAVLLGSGDRTKPFEASVENKFFMIKDRSVSGARTLAPIKLTDLYDATNNEIQNGSASQQEIEKAELLGAKGAYFDLVLGEKAISKTISLNGTAFFNTNQPSASASSPNVCDSSLGIARQYQINFRDLTGLASSTGSLLRYDPVPGGGFPPDPTGIIYQDDEGIHQVVCVGTDCSEEGNLSINVGRKTFWTELFD